MKVKITMDLTADLIEELCSRGIITSIKLSERNTDNYSELDDLLSQKFGHLEIVEMSSSKIRKALDLKWPINQIGMAMCRIGFANIIRKNKMTKKTERIFSK